MRDWKIRVAVIVEGYGDKLLKDVIDSKDKVRFCGPIVKLISKGRFRTKARNGRGVRKDKLELLWREGEDTVPLMSIRAKSFGNRYFFSNNPR